MSSQHEATTLDKLLLIPHLTKVVGAALFRLISLPFVSGPRANTVLKDVVFAALRQHLGTINCAQEQFLDSSTESLYLDFAKAEKFQPETTVLESGLKLHWLGNRRADKIILYFHGGGYALSCSAGHFKWLFGVQTELAKAHSIATVVVAYTVSPKGQYPLQLKQAVESLRWLVQSEGRKPRDIVCAGDSAGGNLCLGLLSHILHPHAEIDQLDLSEPLASAILISPWVEISPKDPSIKQNHSSDMIPSSIGDRWGPQFLGTRLVDTYNQPILADASWFSNLGKIVNDILIWGGGGEILIDSIRTMAVKLKSAHPKTQIVVQEGAAHEDFIFDALLGYKEKPEGTRLVESWISERL